MPPSGRGTYSARLRNCAYEPRAGSVLSVHRAAALLVGADPLLDVGDAVDAAFDLDQIGRRAVVTEIVIDLLGVPACGV